MSMNGTAIPDSPTEDAFRERWIAMAAAAGPDEVALALGGGAISDRLVWVFVSGYQAAVRRCFPEFTGLGWSCFAAAEPENGPACRLTPDGEDYRLDGEKSWIAGAGCVDRLVVAVGDTQSRAFVHVPRDAEGVSITLPRTPSFLKEMNQGAARFEGVRLAPADVLRDPARTQWFRGAEPLYVLVALNACLKAHARAQGDDTLPVLADEAIEVARGLPPLLGEKEKIVPGLRSLRAATRPVVQVAEDRMATFSEALRESWNNDARLLRMFGVAGDESR